MDSKRKSGASEILEDRYSKRRRTSTQDIPKGETPESTATVGLAFLEQLRRTADKSGRLIATTFEKLPPKAKNAAYYKQTKMPISLETIEQKLNDGYFANLAELESYFKRMIANAKEFYPRSSSTFDDAERLRKSLSNYMTKNNPAYNTRGYQAFPTPLPEDDEDGEDDGGEEDDNEEEAEDEDQEEEEDEEEEEEEEEEPSSRRRSIVLKRRGPGRPRRSSVVRPPAPDAQPDHEYEDVPYKGLTFQQAQEKVVEELLRHQEPEYEDAYFEPFINLPPRALKDYYRIVTDPLSLKKLQKLVKGVHGRNDSTGVSDFKSWSAFAEKSKLLWTNAYFYNEEGSEIYALAQELEKAFNKELRRAQTAVPEPSSAKIKLRVGQGDTPASSKKITIHVGGRGGSTDSPAVGTPATTNGDAMETTDSPASTAKKEEGASAAGTPAPGANETAIPLPPQPQIPVIPLEKRRPRRPGHNLDNALLSRLRLIAHPIVNPQQPVVGTIHPDPKYMQNSVVVNLPAHYNRVFVVPAIPDDLNLRQYSLWTMIDKQLLRPVPHGVPNLTPQDRVFEVMLHPGLNLIEAHMIAAIPGHEREEGGAEAELEVFTMYVNVAKA